MKRITTTRMIDNSYMNMCYLEGLPFEIAKRSVQKRVQGYAQTHNYKAYLFVYVSERDIFLCSLSSNTRRYNDLVYEIAEHVEKSRMSWVLTEYRWRLQAEKTEGQKSGFPFRSW